MVSGMLAGIVLAVVREGNFGAVGFMVVVFVYGWWILSFGLTAYQRVFATIIMYSERVLRTRARASGISQVTVSRASRLVVA